MNIADILREHAQNRPDHPAIEDGERVVTYAELEALVDAAAANLQAAGIGAGDIVGIMLPDSADHLIILYALARSGAVIFTLSATASKDEIEMALASVPVKATILAPQAPDAPGNATADHARRLSSPLIKSAPSDSLVA